MQVGDIVKYKGKEYYLYDIYGDNLCRIVRLRDGRFVHIKDNIVYLNANIVNLNMSELRYATTY